MELLLQNCTILDGTGAPAYVGSVGFEHGKMRVFRTGETPPARRTLDASGLALAPGFLDAHSHGDLTLASSYAALSKLSQGYTTQIAGQCGVSLFPADEARREEFTRFFSGIAPHPDLPEDFGALRSAQSFFRWMDALSGAVETKCFVGHGTLRLFAMGYANRRPDTSELEKMKQILRASIRAGALGLSTGLVYAPSCYADNEEILSLLRVVAEEGGVYATHPRNEADTVVEARRESIRMAKEAGVPLCASHLKAAGRDNWGKPEQLLLDLERAADEGLRVLTDCYPYTAGCTALNVSIPPRCFAGGMPGLVAALRDPAERERIRTEILRKSDYENYVYNCGGFSGVYVSSCPVDRRAEGMTVADYAEQTGMDPFDAYCDVLIRNGGLGLGVYFHMCEEDVLRILSHPFCVVGTDGLIGAEGENPHPRVFGTTARAYDRLVRTHKLLTPEALVFKLSGQIADFFHLENKGHIRDGADADAVLLDLEAFRDRATYENGAQTSTGVAAVFKSGRLVYAEKDSRVSHACADMVE